MTSETKMFEQKYGRDFDKYIGYWALDLPYICENQYTQQMSRTYVIGNKHISDVPYFSHCSKSNSLKHLLHYTKYFQHEDISIKDIRINGQKMPFPDEYKCLLQKDSFQTYENILNYLCVNPKGKNYISKYSPRQFGKCPMESIFTGILVYDPIKLTFLHMRAICKELDVPLIVSPTEETFIKCKNGKISAPFNAALFRQLLVTHLFVNLFVVVPVIFLEDGDDNMHMVLLFFVSGINKIYLFDPRGKHHTHYIRNKNIYSEILTALQFTEWAIDDKFNRKHGPAAFCKEEGLDVIWCSWFLDYLFRNVDGEIKHAHIQNCIKYCVLDLANYISLFSSGFNKYISNYEGHITKIFGASLSASIKFQEAKENYIKENIEAINKNVSYVVKNKHKLIELYPQKIVRETKGSHIQVVLNFSSDVNFYTYMIYYTIFRYALMNSKFTVDIGGIKIAEVIANREDKKLVSQIADNTITENMMKLSKL